MNRNLQEDRDRITILANERTYTSWVSTGIAALATGFLAERFLGGVVPNSFLRAISMGLILFSIFSFLLGAWRYQQVGKFDGIGTPLSLILFLSILLSFVGVLAILGIWLY